MRAIMLTLAIAISAVSLAAAAGPAVAGGGNSCATAPEKLRSLSATAAADVQKKAERDIKVGEALCDARNRREAEMKFAAAARTLGTDFAAVMAVDATAAAQ